MSTHQELFGQRRKTRPHRRRVIQRLFLSAALLAASVGATSYAAAPAQAASNGGVYIVTPKSWGWCPNVMKVNNKVTFVSATNFTSGDSRTDSGDDIIWIGVKLNVSNSVQVNVGCLLGHGSSGTKVTITPRRNGQAFFVSPAGYAWGN